jgi:hypothetical protein
MNPSDDQIYSFFVKSISARYGKFGWKPMDKLCKSYDDLLLYEYLMRPHSKDGKLNSLYKLLTDELSNHEMASIVRYENGGKPIYKVKTVNTSEPPKLSFGMLLTHSLIEMDVDHSLVINRCKNLLHQNPKDSDDVFDIAYLEFIKIVAKENQLLLENDNAYLIKLIPKAVSFIKDRHVISTFDLIYVGVLMYISLKQSSYLVDYLFFWNSNIEYWLNNKVSRSNSVDIASIFLQVYQNSK